MLKVSLYVAGAFLVMIAAIIVGVVKVFPKYAPGEAWAMVHNKYPTYQLLGDPEYMMEGRWQLTAEDPTTREDWKFTVYEDTNTIEAQQMLMQAAAPGSQPFDAMPWFLAGNLILLAANIVFALLNWSWARRRRAGRTFP